MAVSKMYGLKVEQPSNAKPHISHLIPGNIQAISPLDWEIPRTSKNGIKSPVITQATSGKLLDFESDSYY